MWNRTKLTLIFPLAPDLFPLQFLQLVVYGGGFVFDGGLRRLFVVFIFGCGDLQFSFSGGRLCAWP